ncbi:MAG: hypothetical protein MRZ79_10145 [Bacteroidia bacterium]|nr:hypothetical protein [Bacteroidia bacterium]
MKLFFPKIIAFLFLLPNMALANLVTNLADHGNGSLRWAIQNAKEGEEINFSQDITGRTIVLNSPITVTQKILTIKGPNRQIIISAPFSSVFKHIRSAQFSIEGISFRDAVSILNFKSSGELLIQNCSFRNIESCFPEVDGSIRINNSSFYKNNNLILLAGKEVFISASNIEFNRGTLLKSVGLNKLVLEDTHFASNRAPNGNGLFQLEVPENSRIYYSIKGCEFKENETINSALFNFKILGAKGHRVDLSDNYFYHNKGKIIFTILDGNAELILNERLNKESVKPCEDHAHHTKNNGQMTYLGNMEFPKFCEGVCILCKSSNSRFRHPIGEKNQAEGHHEDCCLTKIKVF